MVQDKKVDFNNNSFRYYSINNKNNSGRNKEDKKTIIQSI
jgi:hypothetical protein